MNLLDVAPASGPVDSGSDQEHLLEGSLQFVTFAMEGQSYGVPLAQVAEITPNLPLNHLPHMPKGVEGVLDLRGSVIPVINLRIRLGFPPQDYARFDNILVLDTGGNRIGVLVDSVQSVLTLLPNQLNPASPLLAGADGGWVRGFALVGDRVVAILDVALVTALGGTHIARHAGSDVDLEQKLDEGLRELIQMAPRKSEADATKILPQMEAAITHTETEMAKVLDRIESMLASSDQAFQGLARLKQEAQLGHFQGYEAAIAEIEKIGQQVQDTVFDLMQQTQYQDIARQKLERVMKHILGMQAVIGTKLRDVGRV